MCGAGKYVLSAPPEVSGSSPKPLQESTVTALLVTVSRALGRGPEVPPVPVSFLGPAVFTAQPQVFLGNVCALLCYFLVGRQGPAVAEEKRSPLRLPGLVPKP